jgi:hypothetical protein
VTRPARRSITAAVALALAARGACAQPAPDDGDPAVVTPRAELDWLHIDGITGALELEWRLDIDEVEPANNPRRRTDENRLREIFELRTTGFIGHPNLVELDLGGRLWLEQRWVDVEDPAASSIRIDQTLYEWDVNAFLIKNSRTPITLYTRQNISDVDRDFGSALENTFRESGARLNLRNEIFPTNIQVFRREISQEDPTFNTDFDIDQDTLQADGRIEMGQAQRLAWDVQYDDIDESGNLRATRSVDRLEANATHAIEFGDEDQHLLRTRARFYDETGDRELRQIRVDPRLRLRHSDNFHSWYDYSYARDDRFEQDQRSHRATANFRHELFDSLTTIGTGGYEYFEIPTENFDSNEYFGTLVLEYRKQIPLGRLLAGLSVDYNNIDRSPLGTPVAVPEQPFMFNPAGFIVEEDRNVIDSSVTVTDATGTIIYTEGIDYRVQTFPDRVVIERLAGGAIAPGQTVLVEYVRGPEPGGTTETLGLGLDARYTFEEGLFTGLSFYVQYRHQDERRDPFRIDFPENDFDDVRYGVDYNFGKFFVLAERQERSGTLSPFEAYRIEGRYVEPIIDGGTLVFTGLFQEIDRELENLRTTTRTLTGQWNQRIHQGFNVSLIARYRWSDDNRDFDSEAFEQQFDLTWRRGQTEIYAQIRNTMRDTNVEDTTLQRFIVGLRRTF